MRLHFALQLAANAFELGDVDGDPGAAGGDRGLGYVERAACSGDHCCKPGGEGPARRELPCRLGPIGGVEELEAARLRVGEILCLDRLEIGAVGPGEVAALAQPYRLGHGVEERTQARRLLGAAAELAGKAQQLQTIASHFAQAQERAPAHDPALCLHVTLPRRAKRHGESLSPLAQLLDRSFESAGLRRRQP